MINPACLNTKVDLNPKNVFIGNNSKPIAFEENTQNDTSCIAEKYSANNLKAYYLVKKLSFGERKKLSGPNIWQLQEINSLPQDVLNGLTRDSDDDKYHLSSPSHIPKPCEPLTQAKEYNSKPDSEKIRVEHCLYTNEAKFLKLFFSEIGKNNAKVREEATTSKSLDRNSFDFIEHVISANTIMGAGLEAEINTEALKDIVAAGEPCIFIINHSHLDKDKPTLAIFLESLYSEYKKTNKEQTCPKPYIPMAKIVLDSYPDDIKTLYEKTGAVSVYHNLYPSPNNRDFNQKQLQPVIQGFIKGTDHIFIFPEGALAAFKDKPAELKNRFNPGIANIVNMACLYRERVKVVPVGFAYNDDNSSLASIQIGKPVYFKAQSKGIGVSVGNLTDADTTENYKNFFAKASENDFITIQSDKGSINANDKHMKQYIAGILAENLRVIVNQAQDKVK